MVELSPSNFEKIIKGRFSKTEIYHSIDVRFKNHCYYDINIILEMMGKEDRISDFIQTEYVGNNLTRKIADRVAPSKNGNEMINIECESGTDLKYPVMKQEEYCKEIYKHTNLKTKPIMFTTDYNKHDFYKVVWGPDERFYSLSHIYPFYLIDGDAMLKETKEKIRNKEKLKRRQIIFLVWAAYTHYSITKFEMLYEVSKLLNKAKIKNNLLIELKTLHVQDCNRLIKDENKKQIIFGEIDMKCTLFDIAVEQQVEEAKIEMEAMLQQQADEKIKEKDKIIEEKDQEIKEQKREIEEKDIKLEEKNHLIKEKDIKLDKKDQEIKKLKQLLKEKDNAK